MKPNEPAEQIVFHGVTGPEHTPGTGFTKRDFIAIEMGKAMLSAPRTKPLAVGDVVEFSYRLSDAFIQYSEKETKK